MLTSGEQDAILESIMEEQELAQHDSDEEDDEDYSSDDDGSSDDEKALPVKSWILTCLRKRVQWLIEMTISLQVPATTRTMTVIHF